MTGAIAAVGDGVVIRLCKTAGLQRLGNRSSTLGPRGRCAAACAKPWPRERLARLGTAVARDLACVDEPCREAPRARLRRGRRPRARRGGSTSRARRVRRRGCPGSGRAPGRAASSAVAGPRRSDLHAGERILQGADHPRATAASRAMLAWRASRRRPRRSSGKRPKALPRCRSAVCTKRIMRRLRRRRPRPSRAGRRGC